MRRCGRVVCAVAMLWSGLGATAARAQLVGHISPARDLYFAGEPMYVQFELTNVGKGPVQYATGDPYSDGCGSYAIEVQREPAVAHSSCGRGGENANANECHEGTQILAAGETKHENVLVNFAHDVSKAGKYEIYATRAVKFAAFTGGTDLPAGAPEYRMEAQFTIQVLPGDRETLEKIYRPYVVNLGSRDPEIQTDAQRVIVSGAPPWLEDTIVGMLKQSTSREFALLGLRNLNTARSREELAKIVQSTSEYTQQNETAVGYLAQMGDKQYFPLLLEIAKKQPPEEGREYVLAAAELGGEDALPFLRGLLSSTDKAARMDGLMGLERTGSRAAVPLLVEALKDPNAEVGKVALRGLTELTHRSAGEAARGDAPADQAGKWEKWWAANGSAKVYGPRECGEIETLP